MQVLSTSRTLWPCGIRCGVTEQVLVVPLEEGPTLPLLGPGATGTVTAAIWPGIGATARSIVRFLLDPGSSTLAFCHAGEAVYFVRAGSGAVVGTSVDDPPGTPPHEIQLSAGAVVHVSAGTTYRFQSGAADALDFIGGPCPPDPAWFPGEGATAHVTAAEPAP